MVFPGLGGLLNGDLAVLVAYGVLMLAVGWYGRVRARSRDDYLLAGRRLGYGMYLGTLAAVVLGGASTIGTVRLGYVHGLSGVWLVFMLGLGVMALSLLFSSTISALRLYTITGLLAQRYHHQAKRLGGVFMVAYLLMVAVTATMAIGTVVQTMFQLPRIPTTILVSLVVVLYTTWGGMWSLTLTDCTQFVIMTVGVFGLLLPAALRHGGGWSTLHAALPDSFFALDTIGYPTIAGFFLLYFFGILMGQDIWQRLFTARSAAVVRYAGLGAGIYCMFYGLACTIIGMAGHAFLPHLDLDRVDQAFARITMQVLPMPWRGLVASAALAAIMSTASAALLGCATVLRQDVLGPIGIAPGTEGILQNERGLVWLTGIVMLGLVCLMGDVMGALSVAYNLLVGTLLVPTLGALLWRKASATGAWAAMIMGGFVAMVLMASQGVLSPTVPLMALLAALLGFVAGSLARPTTAFPASPGS